jgi:hypothetical protein
MRGKGVPAGARPTADGRRRRETGRKRLPQLEAVIAQQLEVGVDVAAGTSRKAAVEEMRAVLRLALGQRPEPS